LCKKRKKKEKTGYVSINRTPTLMGVPVFKTPHKTMKEKIYQIICPSLTIKKSEQVFSTV